MLHQRTRELRIYRHRARRKNKWRKEQGTLYRMKTKAEKRAQLRSMNEVMHGLALGVLNPRLGLGYAG